MSTTAAMAISKAEREELRAVLKGRARLVKKIIEQRGAQLLADAEQKLAAEYKIDAEAWKDLTAGAHAAVKQADAELARRCRALGIPAEFRPSLNLSWYGRGENALNARRVELRRVAVTRINAMAKEAEVQMETKALDGLELLARSALESAEAQQFLASMPTVEALMPALDVAQLGPLALPRGGDDGELELEEPDDEG
jgi:hypothetical protein